VLVPKEAVEKLCKLYNDYGCCNLAICDFNNILTIDMRARVAHSPLEKLPVAEFAPMDIEPKNWRRFQNTILGFLERGARWTSPTKRE
jgi:hypothetical protein